MTLEITEEWDGETLWKQEDLVAFAPELATAAEMEEDDEECEEGCDCEDCKKEMEETEEESESKCDKDELKAKISEVINSDTNKETLASIANILADLKEFDKLLKNPNSKIISRFAEIDKNMAVSTQNLTKALKSSATVMELTVMNSENTNKTIMLTSFADINEEFLKTAQANELREFLEKQVAESASKASEQLKSEKAAVESEKAALANELETLKKQLADKESQLSALIAEKSQATAQELFSKRMAYFDDKFDLAAEDKQVIAKVLKEVKDDEAFAAYQKDMDILLKGKVKGAKEAVASTVVVNEDKIVKAALDNADPEKVTVTAGSVKEEPKTLIEKYAKYFALNQENFTKR